MTAEGRILIVNADDFGQSLGINRGIVESHELGVVTSVSLMVRGAGAEEAAEYARRTRRLSVGLHLDLGEWSCQQGEWRARYERVPLDDAVAVRDDVYRQLEMFRQFMGREPTHLDSHQHVHREKPLGSVAKELAGELKVPLRHANTLVRYCGRFYGQTRTGETVTEAVSAAALLEIIRTLPAGITELACHPGYADGLATDYGQERTLEIRALCDPQVRRVLDAEGILLRSFGSPDVVARSQTAAARRAKS